MRKDTITIFVSGAKSLKEHRTRLKVLSNDINGELQRQGCRITINMFSYLNLGDNQAEYDNFIKDKSDIVLVLLEDRIGDKTREEFLLASHSNKDDGKPKIIVFLREHKEKTEEIEKIEQLIRENPNNYCVEYTDLDDLEKKVKDQLILAIREKIDRSNLASKKSPISLKSWAWASTIAFLFLLGFCLMHFVSVRNNVTLLFIGGGSAVNCLEEMHPNIGNIYEYPNSFCLAVPTSTSWPIISSEILRHSATERNRVYPISLSAMAAEESNFLNMSSRNQFVNKGSILAYHLGDDYLVAYVKNTVRHRLIDRKEKINVEELSVFLHEISQQNFMIFTTEVGSGTLTSYQRILAPYNITINKSVLGDQVDKFTDLTPKNKIIRDETPYIMLGSRYYVSKEVYKEGDCRGIQVLDMDGKPITKSIILYFPGFITDDGLSFWIPDQMAEFLKKVDNRFESVISKNLLPRKNEKVIVMLNDYLNEITPSQ